MKNNERLEKAKSKQKAGQKQRQTYLDKDLIKVNLKSETDKIISEWREVYIVLAR